MHVTPQLERFASFILRGLLSLDFLWGCQKPLSSFLFPVVPRCEVYASSVSTVSHVGWKAVPRAVFQKAGIFDACFSVLSSGGRSHKLGAFPPNAVSSVSFCLQYNMFSGVSTSCWAFFYVLQPPGIQDFLFLVSVESVETETAPVGGPLKRQSIDWCFILFFPPRGRSRKLVLGRGEGLTRLPWSNFSYLFQGGCSRLWLCLELSDWFIECL